ncbi:flagellar protein [Hoeflea prorocentri]|uniref:Flagellar protein n=1 Tax=Hoeflea prorocentri TaxID=1922333 RepID=A0A9X3UL35_9HYPH|nr:flagellar protein [Hoeflea prorocentri]MCY6382400.1 flagellar protein [Hoeflea prorocentri]MDA5400200.1 flagellar protein [Hoeflea prorocentri]
MTKAELNEETEQAGVEDRKPDPDRTDRVLISVGLVLAAFAAFFPWYVFLNQDQFGVRPYTLSSERDLPGIAGRSVVSVSPLAIPDSGDSDEFDFDSITTATITLDGNEGDNEADPEEGPAQAFPGYKPVFRLLHVVNGRALIEDGNGVYMVRVGSILPDDSRLATLEQRDGRWVIVTSDGDVIER